MEYMEFIRAEFLVFIPALYVIGMLIKNTEKIKDKYIPLILLGISVVLCCVSSVSLDGFSVQGIVTAFVQGVLCAATAVYSNQIIKQTTQK